MTPSILPRDSILHDWASLFYNIETPWSYVIMVGLSMIGASLRRDINLHGRVFPNLSFLLVGPAGLGKNTAIDRAVAMLRAHHLAEEIAGNTIEAIKEEMARMGDPATGYINAAEMTAKFGQQDYKAALIPELTEILSDGDRYAITNKSDLVVSDGFGGHRVGPKRFIFRPTLTLMGGSTLSWLHALMPRKSLEGGFLARIVILKEDRARALAPVPGPEDAYDHRKADQALLSLETRWLNYIRRSRARAPFRMLVTQPAKDFYANWYHNRFKLFSPLVRDYAQRTRGLFDKVSLCCAASRGQFSVDEEDVRFAAKFIEHVAGCVEDCTMPPTLEFQIAKEIVKILPATWAEILRVMMHRYPQKEIRNAMDLLRESETIVSRGNKFENRIDG